MIKLAKNIEQARHNVLLLEEPPEVDQMKEVARVMESPVMKQEHGPKQARSRDVNHGPTLLLLALDNLSDALFHLAVAGIVDKLLNVLAQATRHRNLSRNTILVLQLYSRSLRVTVLVLNTSIKWVKPEL